MADKSTVENILEFFKGMGIDPLGFERAQKSAEAFNDTLINLERTGLTFGKSVERMRDEINKLAFAFNINQKEIVPIYKELHRFKGIKLTDFKEMISILELANVIGNLMNCTVVAPTTEQNTLAGNPKTVNLSLDKYNEEFNKKEFIPINEGLLQTINWQKKIYRFKKE